MSTPLPGAAAWSVPADPPRLSPPPAAPAERMYVRRGRKFVPHEG